MSNEFKTLAARVTELEDRLAKMKRYYEDALSNLDDSNFAVAVVKERNNMKAKITMTAEEIRTEVTRIDDELKKRSTISQTADAIQSVVSKGADLGSAKEINSLDDATDLNAIYVIRSKNAGGKITGEKYYYYNNLMNKWEILSGDSIYTVFEQTTEGFNLKGNVVIDGETVITKNLRLSGNVTWDMANSPVLTRYSSDNLNWHSPMRNDDMYMQMSFDGGNNWSTSTKVVGTDGKDGGDGSDANVTPENVFNALTNDGASQGIFAAFVNKQNKLYINAEYLASKIANVADCINIGDPGDTAVKKIVFSNGGASISTYTDHTGNPPTGIRISATSLSLSSCSNIEWGNNTPVAVFG